MAITISNISFIENIGVRPIGRTEEKLLARKLKEFLRREGINADIKSNRWLYWLMKIKY